MFYYIYFSWPLFSPSKWYFVWYVYVYRKKNIAGNRIPLSQWNTPSAYHRLNNVVNLTSLFTLYLPQITWWFVYWRYCPDFKIRRGREIHGFKFGPTNGKMCQSNNRKDFQSFAVTHLFFNDQDSWPWLYLLFLLDDLFKRFTIRQWN